MSYLRSEDDYQSSISSSQYKSIDDSVKYSAENKVLLDNICNYYILNEKIYFGLNILKKYENILKTGLVDYTVKKEFFYRPEYVSNEIYNTTDLWYLLLFVNNMKSPNEFIKDTIKVPTMEIIEDISNIITNEQEMLESKTYPRLLYKSYMKNPFKYNKGDDNEGYIPPIDIPYIENTDNDIGSLENSSFSIYDVDFYIDKAYIFDNNNYNNIFRIDNNKNIISIPSNDNDETIFKSFSSEVYLDKDYNYRILKLYNGKANFSVNNKILTDNTNNENIIKLPELTFNVNEDYFQLLDYSDQPVSFISKNEHWNLNNLNSVIQYDETIGQYTLVYDNISENDFDNNILSKIYLKTPDFPLSNRNNSYFFNNKDFLEIELVYSMNNNSNSNSFSPLNIQLYRVTTDNDENRIETNIQEYTLSENNIFKTNGKYVSLKRIIPYYKPNNNEKFYYTFSYNVNKNRLSDDIIEFKFVKLSLRGVTLEDISIPIDKVQESGYYNINYTYEYNKNYKGLYFEPIIICNNNINYNTIKNETEFRLKTNDISNNLDINNFMENDLITFSIPSTNNKIELINSNYIISNKTVIDFNIEVTKRKTTNNLSTGNIGLLLKYNNEEGTFICFNPSNKEIDNCNIFDNGIYQIRNTYKKDYNLLLPMNKYNKFPIYYKKLSNDFINELPIEITDYNNSYHLVSIKLKLVKQDNIIKIFDRTVFESNSNIEPLFNSININNCSIGVYSDDIKVSNNILSILSIFGSNYKIIINDIYNI